LVDKRNWQIWESIYITEEDLLKQRSIVYFGNNRVLQTIDFENWERNIQGQKEVGKDGTQRGSKSKKTSPQSTPTKSYRNPLSSFLQLPNTPLRSKGTKIYKQAKDLKGSIYSCLKGRVYQYLVIGFDLST
jgi:hypothetical protein